MPELPEVETVIRTLRPGLIGRRITGVEMVSLGVNRRPNAALRQVLVTPPAEFSRALCGARVEEVRRYGKNIVIELSAPGDDTAVKSILLIHLGMTGRLLWENSPDPQHPHTHVIFALDAPGRWLHYSDTRRFGKLRIMAAVRREAGGVLPKLGPDPLEISSEEFRSRLCARRAMIKAALLDQHFLRGLGNIYADESLFRARIHPAAIASRLNRERAARLYQAIRETLLTAIELGGSSISNYVNADGGAGWFQQEHQVYGRTGQPCTVCGTPIRRIIVAGRSTHFCPQCQRGGRGLGSRPRSRAKASHHSARPVRAARVSKGRSHTTVPLSHGRGSESAGVR